MGTLLVSYRGTSEKGQMASLETARTIMSDHAAIEEVLLLTLMGSGLFICSALALGGPNEEQSPVVQ